MYGNRRSRSSETSWATNVEGRSTPVVRRRPQGTTQSTQEHCGKYVRTPYGKRGYKESGPERVKKGGVV